MTKQLQLLSQIQETQFGKRLDQALAELFPNYSRSRIKGWILDKTVQVDGKIINKPKKKYLAMNELLLMF